MMLPAFVFAGVLFMIAGEIREIHGVDPAAVYRDLESALPRRHPHSFPLPEEILLRDDSKLTVYLFGASSLVLSDGAVFHDYLEEAHDDLQVVNFGISAIDSLTIRQRVAEAFTIARPDIMVLYYGHNDYNVVYHLYILPNYFSQFDCLLRLSYPFRDRSRPEALFADDEYDVFYRLNRPKLFSRFQRLGLVTIDHDAYLAVNNLILDYFKKHNEAILEMAATHGVPVVLITPVGNLRAEPHGDLSTTALYRKGMAATDYRESIEHLKMARDAELFTYDLRAKSALVRYIRELRHPNVHVLDLEKKLEEMRFGFGGEDFVDYFHFNDRTHRLIADVIYDFLKEKKLLKKSASRHR